ncbi:cytochrome P450 [Fomitiporia mediterranea MF3/22]|uniref:cytochrome P450 n=1 Tax=Fomitiporia mediterranea (strain MF3/22) TaxID=694068 RepID=UPI00044074C7|nr:cytochrome P450 [Fomitiporia mediterranea MF3/22]EJD07678.1 cytochrome P450 [Fomitiporia mediterranea MF3/22]
MTLASSSPSSMVSSVFASHFSDEDFLRQNAAYVVAGICVLLVSITQFLKSKKPAVDVPLECASGGIISPYQGAQEFLKSGRSILLDAYKKYGRGTFQIPETSWYTVVIQRPDIIEQVRRAPDDKMSFEEANAEEFPKTFALHLVFGGPPGNVPVVTHVVQNRLTRALATVFDDVLDEISVAFRDNVPATTKDWVAVDGMSVMRNVVCRTSNRIFVGAPLCRNADYIDLNINLTIDIAMTVDKINKAARPFRPIVAKIHGPMPKALARGMRHLRPILEERFRMYDQYGENWSGKPDDMITWVIEELPKNMNRNVTEITRILLGINFAAIHTSSNSFTHALYHLAAEPKYAKPLREEVQKVIAEEGWTKLAMTKMWQLDSFMKESQRFNGVGLMSLQRKVMSDSGFTLSDGTFLPKGTLLAANAEGLHRDNSIYPDADKFDGFRFSRIRNESEGDHVKHQMVNTNAEYLAFGHGRHACPGRFFAVNELKAMMAFIVLNYDVKFENDGARPDNMYFGKNVIPNPMAKVLIRKRVDV